MKLQYPILIEKGDTDTAWGIIVPDMPGCFSAADKQEDILDNAREAILLHLEALADIPSPSKLGDVDSKGFIVGLVDINLDDFSGKSKRINITVPEIALSKIDAIAASQGKSRSAYMTESALANLE